MILDILPSRPKSKTVTAEILYLEHAEAKPAARYERVSTGEFSALYAPRRVVIRDAREMAPRLDVEGFELIKHQSAVRNFWNDLEVERVGRVEAAAIVAEATGATHVHVFDHTQRRATPDSPRQPSSRAHNDYTPDSARRRVRELLGEAAARQPFAFINVWRPITRPALGWPLTLCDARSIEPGDLVATDIQYADRRGEIYHVRHNPRHRWYYAPNMQLDEAWLIKCADTRESVAQGAPHTSFDNPLAPDAPPRESIEFRTIALFPAKEPIQIGRLR